MTDYRIVNIDNNLQIQRRVKTKTNPQRWKVISYHGNSLFSLISGLSNLLMRDFTPEGETLSQQLESARLEMVLAEGRIEKMVREWAGNEH